MSTPEEAARRILTPFKKERPTVAELEAILKAPDGAAVTINPDGSIGVGDTDAVIVARAYLELIADLKEANEAVRELQQEACNRAGVPMPSQRSLVDTLREREAKLREALEKIINDAWSLSECEEIAREALADKGGTETPEEAARWIERQRDNGSELARNAEIVARACLAAPAREARLREALENLTNHFVAIMGGPMVAGGSVRFPDGVEGIPLVKAAREALADKELT